MIRGIDVKETPAGCVMDWSKGEFDHPAGVAYGPGKNVVTVNGIDQSGKLISKLKTGEGGFIEFFVADGQGVIAVDMAVGEAVKDRLTGLVRHWRSED